MPPSSSSQWERSSSSYQSSASLPHIGKRRTTNHIHRISCYHLLWGDLWRSYCYPFKDKIVYNLKNILGDQLDDQLSQGGSSHFYNQGPNNTCFTSDVGYLWDWAQITFECCGINSDADYKNRMNVTYTFKTMCPNLNQMYLPVSCCPLKATKTFGDFHSVPDNQYNAQTMVDCTIHNTVGCYDAVARWIERYAPVLIGIGIGFAMLELFGIIFAVCLCRNTGDD